nr:MAG TPA: hypothetical protein [Caudoviricetes sp.]
MSSRFLSPACGGKGHEPIICTTSLENVSAVLKLYVKPVSFPSLWGKRSRAYYMHNIA